MDRLGCWAPRGFYYRCRTVLKKSRMVLRAIMRHPRGGVSCGGWGYSRPVPLSRRSRRRVPRVTCTGALPRLGDHSQHLLLGLCRDFLLRLGGRALEAASGKNHAAVPNDDEDVRSYALTRVAPHRREWCTPTVKKGRPKVSPLCLPERAASWSNRFLLSPSQRNRLNQKFQTRPGDVTELGSLDSARPIVAVFTTSSSPCRSNAATPTAKEIRCA